MIQRLLLGTVLGVALGGLFAAALIWLGAYFIAPPVNELVALYGGDFILHNLSPAGVAALAGLGAALGWLGAMLSTAIHLRQVDA